jgi:hypothetical protein
MDVTSTLSPPTIFANSAMSLVLATTLMTGDPKAGIARHNKECTNRNRIVGSRS